MAASPQNPVISEIAQNLNDYYRFYPQEKIQLTTDKEVYKPEETIWFSLLVTNPAGQLITPESEEFTINLYSGEGTKLSTDVYKTAAGPIQGDLLLPQGLAEGKYVLVAGTSLMSRVNQHFCKLIYINPKNEQAFRLKETATPSLLEPGKNNTFSFVLEEMNGEPLKKQRLKFELYHKDEIILNDKLKTDHAGVATIKLEIPEKDYEQPLKLVISGNKNEVPYTKFFPVKNEKISIRFYPEGGHLRAGIPQKIGIRATDQFGQPVNVSGEIRDDEGNKPGQFKTSAPGYGILPVQLDAAKKYMLHLTSELGKDQQFDLPEVRERFSLAITRVDADFIHANLIPEKDSSRTIYLLATKGPDVFWVSGLTLKSATRLKIPKEDFPHGISMLSVFDEQGNVLAGRLVFADQKHELKIDVAAPEQVKAGEVFKFAVETSGQSAETPLKLNMAISAASENVNWPYQWDSWLLINSDLENTYTNARELQKSESPESTINYLLIANKFKNFDWNKILHFDSEWEQNKFMEKGVFGKVVNKNGEIVPKAKVSFMNSQNMQIMNASTDESGEFFIQAIDAGNLGNFAVNAIGPDGRDDLQVVFEKSMEEQLSDHVIQFVKSHSRLEQIQYTSNFFNQNEALFAKIKRSNSVGLIEIKTKRGEGPTIPEMSLNEESLYENGYRVARDFWQVKSKNPGTHPTTLFWDPAVRINENGRWDFEVSTNHVLGQFQIRVDAIEEDGRITQITKTVEVIP